MKKERRKGEETRRERRGMSGSKRKGVEERSKGEAKTRQRGSGGKGNRRERGEQGRGEESSLPLLFITCGIL